MALRPATASSTVLIAVLLTAVLVVPAGLVGSSRSLGSSSRPACPGGATGSCVPVHGPAPARGPAPNASGNTSSNFTANWSEIYPTSSPSGRTQPAMAYDPTIQAVVLFGGYDPTVAADGDTWTFTNNNWTQITSNLTISPPARWGAQMVWDAADGYLVLFGGRDVTGYLNDTWTFNGTSWTNVTKSVAPPPRSLFEMAYDPVDRAVIADGGAIKNFSSGVFYDVNSTWSYSAGNWTNISAAAPGGALDRAAGQAVYDPWNRSVLFVGGGDTANWTTSGCTPIDPVQTYVNGSWYEYPSSVGPPEVSQEMMAYDPAGPYDFLFGGYAPSGSPTNCVQINSTWIRSAGVWYNLSGSLGRAPSIRYLSGIAFDPILDEIVLFGGNGQGAYLSDSWVFRVANLDTLLFASRQFGVVPLTVNFDADVVGGAHATAFNWTFGDGASSITTVPKLSYTFDSPGTFNVSVNVTGGTNLSFVASTIIAVAPPVVPSVSASPLLGSVPLRVSFEGGATGGFGGPFVFNWSFGDGAHSSLAEVNHTYTSAGNFTAILDATDRRGDLNRTSVLIQVGPQLMTRAAASRSRGVAPLWVNFTSTTAGGTGADTYLWSFGDDSSSTQPDPTHEFLQPGNYSVEELVTDSLGRTANSTLVVTVYPDLGAAIVVSSPVGIAPYSVTFDGSSTGGDGPYVYTWSFGDGSAGTTGIAVGHTYVNPGTYTADLEVNDSLGDLAQATEVVTVVGPLTAKVASSVATGEAPEPVSFSFSSFSGGEGPFTFTWTFGDGATASTGSEANHTYARAGAYTVKVAVGDALHELVASTVDLVIVPAVSLSLSSGFGTLTAGTPDNLSVRATGGESPYSYAWTGLPTGCTSENAAILACTPTAAAESNVTVTVTDAFGRTATVNGTLIVSAAPNSPTTGGSGGGSSFPIWYAAVGFILAAGAVAGIAYWAGRRRGGSGRPPFSAPDTAPSEGEEFTATGASDTGSDG